MCNPVSNPVTSAFVTLPQRNGAPDPTRPDPNYRTQASIIYVTLRNARLSTGRASAPDARPTQATRMMPGGAR